jgi:hypothetical protein
VPLLTGHLELGPAEITGPGIFLPGLLHGSVLQYDQKAVGAFLLLFPRHVCKLYLDGGSASDISTLGAVTHAPTESGEIP